MKRIFVIIMLGITSVLSACLILNGCKKKTLDEVLSVKMINNYTISNKERRINQVLYFNRDNIFNNYDIVDSVSLVDEESESILKLKINNIKKTSYQHKYKDKKYNSYLYDLSIPVINSNMYFKNAKIEIVSEDKTLLVPIGIVDIRYDEFDKALTVESLEGKCAYNPFQSLSTINIGLESKTNNNITIKSMNMGSLVDLTFDTSDALIYNSTNTNINEQIIGYMKTNLSLRLSYKEKYVLKESYIEIIYNDTTEDKKVYIDTFNFYDNGYAIPIEEEVVMVNSFKI